MYLKIVSYHQTQVNRDFQEIATFQTWFNFLAEILTELFLQPSLILDTYS